MKTVHLIASLAASLCCHAAAGAVEAKRDAAVTVFAGANVIDGTGAPALHDQFVVIDGDKIKSITPTKPSVDDGARIIDAHGKTIMPALILGHAHLGLQKGMSISGSNITAENDIRQLRRYGKYGICLVMSLGDDHDVIYDLRRDRNKGVIGGPYIMTAGHGIGVAHGAPPLETGADQIYRPTTVAAARNHVDDLAHHHVDIIKLWVDDLDGKAPKMQPEMYKAIISEAHRHGLKVAAHVWCRDDAKAVVSAGVDVLAHSIRDVSVDSELISAMKAKGVYQIPTLELDESFFVFKQKPEWMRSKFFKDSLDRGVLKYLMSSKYRPSERERKASVVARKNLKTLYDAGVKVAFGTDTGGLERPAGFGEHRELELMVEAGLRPLQAIQCATQTTSEMLGVSKRMGTLAAGKLANMIVLDADPSVNISNTQKISSVWIDGKEFK
jgi:imidazolonepropionase-like amidohydrolase